MIKTLVVYNWFLEPGPKSKIFILVIKIGEQNRLCEKPSFTIFFFIVETLFLQH